MQSIRKRGTDDYEGYVGVSGAGTPADPLRPHVADLMLEIAAGNVKNLSVENKFGRATNGLQTTCTDIWDRADSSATQQIWLAPTAARIHTLVSADATDICGVGELTLTGQPLDTETVTIGTKVYTFQTTLTDVDGNVLIGACASESIDNLIAAINLAAGAGTAYATAMTANAVDILATVGAGDTMLVYDRSSGNIASTQALTNGTWDNGSIVPGVGARIIRVYYLPDWDTKETYEDVVLFGDVGVAMVASAVMINRMKAITYGASGPNVGIITATAATDTTVSAQINAGIGQTNMAIYGIPSLEVGYLTCLHLAVHGVGTPANPPQSEMHMLVNESPQLQPKVFINKANAGFQATGSTNYTRCFRPYRKIAGPAIIKFQGTSSLADNDAVAEFDLILADNLS